eukprot:1224068-Amorphochlora_amoeboformis.AAC.1
MARLVTWRLVYGVRRLIWHEDVARPRRDGIVRVRIHVRAVVRVIALVTARDMDSRGGCGQGGGWVWSWGWGWSWGLGLASGGSGLGRFCLM